MKPQRITTTTDEARPPARQPGILYRLATVETALAAIAAALATDDGINTTTRHTLQAITKQLEQR